MRKIKNLVIRVDGDQDKYIITSDGIRGQVYITLTQDIAVNYFRINLVGKSKCKFFKGSGKKRKVHKSTDVIVDETLELLRMPGSPPVQLTLGSHSIPFTFGIQNMRQFPSSFEGKYGSIRYKFKVKLDRQGVMFDDNIGTVLNIYNPPCIDLPQYMEPVAREGEYHSGACCFSSGPMILRASLNKTGIAFGDMSILTLSIDNLSSNVLTPKVSLVQYVKFATKNHSQNSKAVIRLLSGEAIRKNTRKNIRTFNIRMSGDNLHETLQIVENIFISHVIKIKIHGSGLLAVFPISIGRDSRPPLYEPQLQTGNRPMGYPTVYTNPPPSY